MVELSAKEAKQADMAARRENIQGDSFIDTAMTNLGLKELPRGKILDIGAGIFGEFQSRVRERFPNTEIISMNPLFSEKIIKNNIQMIKEEHGVENSIDKSVAGIAEQEPFKDDSFDLVISHAAIPVHLPEEPLNYESAISEAIRVVKQGGDVILAPMYDRHVTAVKQVIEKLKLSSNVLFRSLEIPVGDYSRDNGFEKWFRVVIHKK